MPSQKFLQRQEWIFPATQVSAIEFNNILLSKSVSFRAHPVSMKRLQVMINASLSLTKCANGCSPLVQSEGVVPIESGFQYHY